VKVVDANVLLYAVNRDAPHHASARKWLDTALAGDEAVGFAWVVLLAFLRLSTRPGLFPHPLTLQQAVSVIEAWLARPMAILLEPTTRHLRLLHGLLAPLSTAANLVTDAHLAALAIEHGAEVVSFDTDFSRFQGLRWSTPATL
jgi:toxin-antitoxin system PIN domain toxin